MLLKTLEKRIGREEVIRLAKTYGFECDYTTYPRDNTTYLDFIKDVKFRTY